MDISPDVVVVGGGPIGLWTAIQTKLLTKKEIVVIEKYEEYKRADIRLNIAASSLSGTPNHPPLQSLVKKWGNQAVPIKEMEDDLTICANELGIKILKGEAAKPSELQEKYPSARVFIGADGARSTFRKEIFKDQYKFNTPLQYMVQVQYLIKAPKPIFVVDGSLRKMIDAADAYSKQKFAGHLITQNIRDLENEQSQVTLRIFIDEKIYREMADATFSTPYYFEKDLDKVPEIIQDTLIKWWGTQNQLEIISDHEKTNKLTVIPLASYAAKEVFNTAQSKTDPDTQVVNALVGDASQAYPFFRAINNGLLLGTRLAQCIGRAFEDVKQEEGKNNSPDKETKKYRAELFTSYFNSYSRYSTYRAYVEYITAFVKNIFILISSSWIKFSSWVPWQSVKISYKQQEECYERGAVIWKKLSGLEPPPFKPKNLKALVNLSTEKLGY